ncbi:MAG TPA: DNA polymerase III subunit gamma/tau [Candidatus Saccharimonadales bacterium]|nr:DNA polymerase III subunit gamma/tau [Candidatus Saccharimonadales bacterium]
MGQALYRKYRSKTLDEIVGQEHITKTIGEAIKRGQLSHAYLFTGPRGVGKTSIARIVAHEINNLPYNDDVQHIDIIEIDAASNRRIDEIRELREKVYVAPSIAKYKVYIIDEVHMLTREAFNALLKTLEEPPAHVVFILATTDAHKLPDTIISRTQRFIFRPADPKKVVAHLRYIAEQEKISVTDSALTLLAHHGEGSFRDSISLLDQASGLGKKIDVDDVHELLGIPPQESIREIIRDISENMAQSAVQTLQMLYDQGYQAANIAKQLGALLRAQITDESSTIPYNAALSLLGRLLDVPASHDPERFLEIILLETIPAETIKQTTVLQASPPHSAATSQKAQKPQPETTAKNRGNEKLRKSENEQASSVKVGSAPSTQQPVIQSAKAITTVFDISLWPQILTALKKKHNTVYSIARMAQPTVSEKGTLELAFAFAFHQKRLNDARNRKLLSDTIQEITGQLIQIECTFNKEVAQSTPTPLNETNTIVDNAEISKISTIFGGGEVLGG